MTRLLPEAIRLIQEAEGLRLTAYHCPSGRLTIGYGHTGKEARPGRTITRAQAERILRDDLAQVEKRIAPLVDVPVGDGEWSALVSFTFNVGVAAFGRSSVRKRLNAGDARGAAAAFELWVKARDPKTGKLRTLPGLVRRRAAEKALFLRQAAQG